MKAPTTKIMPCGHKFQCVISGHEDCQQMCAYKARQVVRHLVVAPQEQLKCVECGKVCHGISYCGCHGWD